MTDNLKPFIVVREVGQPRFEAECCALMKQGYLPAGGPIVMEVVHPITGQSGMGFFQAMYLPPVYRREGATHILTLPRPS